MTGMSPLETQPYFMPTFLVGELCKVHYSISSLPNSHHVKFAFNWDVIFNDHKDQQSWCGAVQRGLTLSSYHFLSIFLCHTVRGTWPEARIPDSGSGSGTMNNGTPGRLVEIQNVGKVGGERDGERCCLGQ